MVELVLRHFQAERVKRVEAMVGILLLAVALMFLVNKVLALDLRQLQILVAAVVAVANQAHREVVVANLVEVMAALA